MSIELIVFNDTISAGALRRFLDWHRCPFGCRDYRQYTNHWYCQPAVLQWYREMSVIFPDLRELARQQGMFSSLSCTRVDCLGDYAFDVNAASVTLLESCRSLAEPHVKRVARALNLKALSSDNRGRGSRWTC